RGRASGLLYAGAQATPDVGASAVLGGDTSQGGFGGSEAYANGKVNSHTRTIVAGNTYQRQNAVNGVQPVTEGPNAIQKIHPPKKYHSSQTLAIVPKAATLDKETAASTSSLIPTSLSQSQQYPARRQLIAPPPPPHPADAMTPCSPSKPECKTVNRDDRSGVVTNALQIPIGILQSLQQSLGNFAHH
ncbi:hypothetical protein DOY81_012653, partial [Sarcophaga bullata]